MEYENPTSRQCLNPDIISHVPQNIIESILSLLPLRDAVRTSVLSKKWRYSWWGMPKLVFTRKLINSSVISGCTEWKCNLAKAIFHVFLFHKGPQVVEFNFRVGFLDMKSEFAQMIRYLATRNCVKELSFNNDNSSYKLPGSFFSLQGLERMRLQNCTFEPPLTFNGFSKLKRIALWNVVVTTQALEWFLSKCPQLEQLILLGSQEIDFAAEGNKFTFVDLLLYVPLIKSLAISKYYMKASRHVSFQLHEFISKVCLSPFVCSIRSSPVLKKIVFRMYNKKLPVQQTPAHFLDSENHPDLKLDHLETLDIRLFSGLPLKMEFVKLIMAKSPKLEKVRIELNSRVCVYEERKIRGMLLLLASLRASAPTKLSVLLPKTS